MVNGSKQEDGMRRVGLIAIMVAMGFIASGAMAELAHHPELKKAHETLETALQHLKQANDHEKSEFGGHRNKAEQLIREAQREINEAAQWADTHK